MKEQFIFILIVVLACITIMSFAKTPEQGPPTENEGRNHLGDTTSPYLLQHQHNPVHWYPWGEEALSKAKNEDKPILVSIGYSACHWCHVMAHESFENDSIAAIMNTNFVNIKIDREERPDIDQIYMEAVKNMRKVEKIGKFTALGRLLYRSLQTQFEEFYNNVYQKETGHQPTQEEQERHNITSDLIDKKMKMRHTVLNMADWLNNKNDEGESVNDAFVEAMFKSVIGGRTKDRRTFYSDLKEVFL